MSKKFHSAEDELQAVMDALAESILEASDEEILAEVRDMGKDPASLAENIRAVLLEAVTAYQKRKLHEARQSYEQRVAALRKKQYQLPRTPEGRLQLLKKIFAQKPELRPALLTVQYRRLSGLGDVDVQSLLMQLQELDVLKDLVDLNRENQ